MAYCASASACAAGNRDVGNRRRAGPETSTATAVRVVPSTVTVGLVTISLASKYNRTTSCFLAILSSYGLSLVKSTSWSTGDVPSMRHAFASAPKNLFTVVVPTMVGVDVDVSSQMRNGTSPSHASAGIVAVAVHVEGPPETAASTPAIVTHPFAGCATLTLVVNPTVTLFPGWTTRDVGVEHVAWTTRGAS